MDYQLEPFVAVTAVIATSQLAMAQVVPGGVERGARDSKRSAGPVGAVVGATAGSVVGGVAGVLDADDCPRLAMSKFATCTVTRRLSRSWWAQSRLRTTQPITMCQTTTRLRGTIATRSSMAAPCSSIRVTTGSCRSQNNLSTFKRRAGGACWAGHLSFAPDRHDYFAHELTSVALEAISRPSFANLQAP